MMMNEKTSGVDTEGSYSHRSISATEESRRSSHNLEQQQSEMAGLPALDDAEAEVKVEM